MRRIAAFLLFFLLLLSARAELYAVRFPGIALAVNDLGEAVIPAGEYDDLAVLSPDARLAVGKMTDGKLLYALTDTDGEPVTEFLYDGLYSAGEEWYCRKDNAFYYAGGGHPYSDMTYAGESRVLALTGNLCDDIPDPLYLLCPDGISIDTGVRILNGLSDFSEELCALLDGDARLYGYADNSGGWALSPAYRYAGAFQSGLAVVADKTGYGLIDQDGTEVLPMTADLILRDGGRICALSEGVARMYSDELEPLFEVEAKNHSASLMGGRLVLQSADGCFVYDDAGEIALALEGSASVCGVCSTGALVRRDGQASLCGWDGQTHSEGFDVIRVLTEDLLVCANRDEDGTLRCALMGADGTLRTELRYRSISRVSDRLFCAALDNGAVLLDGEGAVVNTFSSTAKTNATVK